MECWSDGVLDYSLPYLALLSFTIRWSIHSPRSLFCSKLSTSFSNPFSSLYANVSNFWKSSSVICFVYDRHKALKLIRQVNRVQCWGNSGIHGSIVYNILPQYFDAQNRLKLWPEWQLALIHREIAEIYRKSVGSNRLHHSKLLVSDTLGFCSFASSITPSLHIRLRKSPLDCFIQSILQ